MARPWRPAASARTRASARPSRAASSAARATGARPPVRHVEDAPAERRRPLPSAAAARALPRRHARPRRAHARRAARVGRQLLRVPDRAAARGARFSGSGGGGDGAPLAPRVSAAASARGRGRSLRARVGPARLALRAAQVPRAGRRARLFDVASPPVGGRARRHAAAIAARAGAASAARPRRARPRLPSRGARAQARARDFVGVGAWFGAYEAVRSSAPAAAGARAFRGARPRDLGASAARARGGLGGRAARGAGEAAVAFAAGGLAALRGPSRAPIDLVKTRYRPARAARVGENDVGLAAAATEPRDATTAPPPSARGTGAAAARPRARTAAPPSAPRPTRRRTEIRGLPRVRARDARRGARSSGLWRGRRPHVRPRRVLARAPARAEDRVVARRGARARLLAPHRPFRARSGARGIRGRGRRAVLGKPRSSRHLVERLSSEPSRSAPSPPSAAAPLRRPAPRRPRAIKPHAHEVRCAARSLERARGCGGGGLSPSRPRDRDSIARSGGSTPRARFLQLAARGTARWLAYAHPEHCRRQCRGSAGGAVQAVWTHGTCCVHTSKNCRPPL